MTCTAKDCHANAIFDTGHCLEHAKPTNAAPGGIIPYRGPYDQRFTLPKESER